MIHRFKKKTHSLHQTASGISLEIDIWEYSPGATQCIYLQGGLHGVELTGIPVLMRFMKELEESEYPERIICVPWSNPMGLDSQIMGQQTGYNNLHTNQQNCWNWNRITHLKDEGSLEGRWISTCWNFRKKPIPSWIFIPQAMRPYLMCMYTIPKKNWLWILASRICSPGINLHPVFLTPVFNAVKKL